MRGYDRGYGRGYDYGLRGWPQTAEERRPPVRTRYTEERYPVRGGGYDRGYHGGPYREMSFNHVTARYNRDYVDGPARQRPLNPFPYGGDREGRVDDFAAYRAPYQTVGGSRTWRGEWPVGWERRQAWYDDGYRDGRGDRGRWF